MANIGYIEWWEAALGQMQEDESRFAQRMEALETRARINKTVSDFLDFFYSDPTGKIGRALVERTTRSVKININEKRGEELYWSPGYCSLINKTTFTVKSLDGHIKMITTEKAAEWLVEADQAPEMLLIDAKIRINEIAGKVLMKT